MIISPCISICKTDPSTGYCYGCGRSNEEKRLWKLEETTDDWKKENIIQIEKRLTGWQLESFKESYSYKIKNGMSLFKKNLIETVKKIYLERKKTYSEADFKIRCDSLKPELIVNKILDLYENSRD